MKTFSLRRSPAFTLVELLVVIGIISILIALLIPALSKMRESAKQVTCSGNLRALGQAMIAYASENDGYLPATSQANPRDENPADWIWWQPDRLAATMGDANAMIRQSALAKYLSLSSSNTSMLRCPSDNVEVHQPNRLANPPTPYPYSYVMNCFIAGNSSVVTQGIQGTAARKFIFTNWPGPNPPAYAASLCRSLHKVVNPSQKVLMYEQTQLTIDDGEGCPWRGASQAPNPYWGDCGGDIDLLSPYHDLANFQVQLDPMKEDTSHKGNYTDTPPNLCAVPFMNARGNVVFCDGHVDFVPRSFLHLPEHTLGSY